MCYMKPYQCLYCICLLEDQLNNIKTTRLARIICRNTHTTMIQPNIFRKVGPGYVYITTALFYGSY